MKTFTQHPEDKMPVAYKCVVCEAMFDSRKKLRKHYDGHRIPFVALKRTMSKVTEISVFAPDGSLVYHFDGARIEAATWRDGTKLNIFVHDRANDAPVRAEPKRWAENADGTARELIGDEYWWEGA